MTRMSKRAATAMWHGFLLRFAVIASATVTALVLARHRRDIAPAFLGAAALAAALFPPLRLTPPRGTLPAEEDGADRRRLEAGREEPPRRRRGGRVP